MIADSEAQETEAHERDGAQTGRRWSSGTQT